MGGTDRLPLADTPTTQHIASHHNNRLGAVYSSLYAFWRARYTATSGAANRRDAYSIILFDQGVTELLENNFTSTPRQLLETVLRYGPKWGTNYTAALQSCTSVMEQFWSTERYIRSTACSSAHL